MYDEFINKSKLEKSVQKNGLGALPCLAGDPPNFANLLCLDDGIYFCLSQLRFWPIFYDIWDLIS